MSTEAETLEKAVTSSLACENITALERNTMATELRGYWGDVLSMMKTHKKGLQSAAASDLLDNR